jgi:hypothetical protein
MSRRCLTLCIKKEAHREWGFWVGGRWVPWRAYVAAKGLEPN